MKRSEISATDLEQRIELLKERIYATLALLAILLTIDTGHTSPAKAAIIVGGTALSLWAASIVASRMSYRIIMQQPHHDPAALEQQFVRHSPLLVAAIIPLFTIFMSSIGVIRLPMAIDLATFESLLLILGWSLLSARAVGAGKLSTLILAAAHVAIGLAIVGLKIFASHQ